MKRQTRQFWNAALIFGALLTLLATIACAPLTPVAPSAAQPTAAPAQPTSAPQPTTAVATTAPQPTTAPATTAPTSAPSAAADTLTFWIGESPASELWKKLAQEFEAAHPNIKVQAEVIPTGSQGTGMQDKLGTALLAGAPPDVVEANVSMLGQAGLFDTPLLVDQTPYITPELKADYGQILDTYLVRGKLYGYPTAVRVGFAPFIANKKMLQDAGIDYKTIQQKGWTWEEFVSTLNKLKKSDASGTVSVWPLIVEGSQWHLGMMYSNFARTNCLGANHSGNPMYGNKFNYGGPKMVEAVQFVHDLIYKHSLIPKEAVGMNVEQMTQAFLDGKTAVYMTEPGLVDPIKKHNEDVKSGKLQGKEIDIESVLLPVPYNPPCKTTADTRPSGIMVFRQEPAKSEEHIKNAVALAQFLVSTDAMVRRYKEVGWAPATQSAIKALPELSQDEYAQGFYAILNLASTPNPPNHPNWFHLYWDIIYPISQAVIADKQTAQAAVDEWTKASVADMEDWVAKNPDVAKELAEFPPIAEWPGPLFECDRGLPENYQACTFPAKQ